MTTAALACPCGARDEIREPAPDLVRCWSCKRETMARYTLRYPPPASAGRVL